MMPGHDRCQPQNRNGQGRTLDLRPGPPNQQEDTVPVNTQPRRNRPSSAPAYYLGRPASFWITLTSRRSGAPDARRQTTWTPIARQAA
jgi:hypothetical protein